MREKKIQDDKKAQEEKEQREALQEMQKRESLKGQRGQELEVDDEKKGNKPNSPRGRYGKSMKNMPKKPVSNKEGAAATMDQVEADYLKALEIDERKEYNLRRNTTTRNSPAKVAPTRAKMSTAEQHTR